MSFIIGANWSVMKRRILIGSLRGTNFAIRTAKMEDGPVTKQYIYVAKLFPFSVSIFSDIKKNARNILFFNLSFMLEFQYGFCFPEPLTEEYNKLY